MRSAQFAARTRALRNLRVLLMAAACSGVACIGLLVQAQSPLLDTPKNSVGKIEAVEFLYPEQVTVAAGKPAAVMLHFRIAAGLHINSHKPKDAYLIPTVLTLPPESGVRLETANYPEGSDFVLPADPSARLSVYTGEFTIDARLVAAAGDHLVEAKLRYQACDQNACMPPKSITVPIDIVGK